MPLEVNDVVSDVVSVVSLLAIGTENLTAIIKTLKL